MDIADTIAPKSDQLNADDLRSGPRTFTITRARVTQDDQPVWLYLDEWEQPYKPCKTMRRVLMGIWGEKSADYAGRQLTLFRESRVRFGGETVGGIRISHASHIDGPQKVSIITGRGKRGHYEVQPLTTAPTAPTGPTPAELAAQVAQGIADSTTEAEVREWGNRAHARGVLDLSPEGTTGTLREQVTARLADLTDEPAEEQS